MISGQPLAHLIVLVGGFEKSPLFVQHHHIGGMGFHHKITHGVTSWERVKW